MNDTEKAAHANGLDEEAANYEALAYQLRLQAQQIRRSLMPPGTEQEEPEVTPAPKPAETHQKFLLRLHKQQMHAMKDR